MYSSLVVAMARPKATCLLLVLFSTALSVQHVEATESSHREPMLMNPSLSDAAPGVVMSSSERGHEVKPRQPNFAKDFETDVEGPEISSRISFKTSRDENSNVDSRTLALQQNIGKMEKLLYAQQENVPIAPFGPRVEPKVVKFKIPEVSPERSITPLAGSQGIEFEKLPEPVVDVKDKYEIAEDKDVNMYQLVTSGPCVTNTLMPEAGDMIRAASSDCGVAGTHQVGKSRKPGEKQCPGAPYECSRNGICKDGVCLCLPAWEGNDCGSLKCSPPCASHARCDNGTCICPEGWQGDKCDERTCDPPCSINGQCEDSVCVCAPGYYGDSCELAMCPGVPQCSGFDRGTCNTDKGVCVCKKGFGGLDCSEAVKMCNPVCENGGKCVDGTCRCGPGYTGATCSTLLPRDYKCEGGAEWQEFASPIVKTCANLFTPDTTGSDEFTARCMCPLSAPIWDTETRSCVAAEFCGLSLCGDIDIPGPDEAVLAIYSNKGECDTEAVGTCSGCAASTEPVGVCYRAGINVLDKMKTSQSVVLGLERVDGTCPGDFAGADFEQMLENSNLGTKGIDSTSDNPDGTTTVVHTVIVPPEPDFAETPRVNLTERKHLSMSGFFEIPVNCTGTYRAALILVDDENHVDMFSNCIFGVEKPPCPGDPVCSGNGVCNTSFATPLCSCKEGFTGRMCDIGFRRVAYGSSLSTLPGGIVTSLHIPRDAVATVKASSTVVKYGNTSSGFTVMTFSTNGTVQVLRPDNTIEYITEHHMGVDGGVDDVVDVRQIVGDDDQTNHSTTGAMPGRCPSNQLWQQCSSGCLPSCRNPEPRCMPTCLNSSCQCPIEAPLWDEQVGECVLPNMCSEQSECPGTGPVCSGNGHCVPYGIDDAFKSGSRCMCFEDWSGSNCEIYKLQSARVTLPSGTSSEAVACHFPFVYRGKEYFDCTSDFDSDGKEWCSTTYEWEGLWGLCGTRDSCPTYEGVVCGGRGTCVAGSCKCFHGFVGSACESQIRRWVNNSNGAPVACAFPYVGPDNVEHYDCMRGTPLIDSDGDLVGHTNGTTEWCLITPRWNNFSSFGQCLPRGSCGHCPSGFGTCDTTTGRCNCRVGFSGDSCSSRLTETDVLQLLFTATKGHYWTRTGSVGFGGWGTNTPPCGDGNVGGWSGVTCHDGKVTRISLSASGLAGTIPSELAALTHLQVLDLSHNNLKGTIPAIFSEAPAKLKSVILSDNYLTGTVPNFSNRLGYLDVTNNYFVGGATTNFNLDFSHRVTNGEGLADPFTECAFPFTFNGRAYTQCTTDFSESGEAWCSTTPNYDGHWGKCARPGTCAGFDGVQCSGNGECEIIYTGQGAAGKCNCHDGWYGVDCSTRAVRVTKTVKTGEYEEHHGRLCQLPFAYEGKLYHDCTTDGSATKEPWCLLTKQWARSWGYCAPVGTCPGKDANCSGHGECRSNGTCACDSGWGWNDCSHKIPRVTEGTYQRVGSVCHFPFTLNGVEYDDCTTAPSFKGDPYCAVKAGDLASHRQWDFCAPVGTCPGDPVCSGDGACFDGECVCDPGFTGLACEHEMSDRDILTKLFRSTGGQLWLQNHGWEDVHECQWYGISCDLNGRVTGISLSKNNLDGTLPEELGLISTLLSLDFSGNYLAGTIPSRFSSLPVLQYVDVSNNEFVGALPVFGSSVKVLKCEETCVESGECKRRDDCLDSLRHAVLNITIDCSMDDSLCDANAICVEETVGLYRCVCQAGYHGDGTQCRENECKLEGSSPLNGYTFAGDTQKMYTVSELKHIGCTAGYRQQGTGAGAPKASCSASGSSFVFSGCTACQPGKFSSVGDAARCLPCGTGSFNPDAGATYCQACPQSTFLNATGSTSASNCNLCPVGKHGVEGVGHSTEGRSCQECSPGQFQDEEGKMECNACNALLGEYQNDYGQASCDVDCAGEWMGCDVDCIKTYTVTVPAQGGGLPCNHIDGFSAACAEGEGDCPVVDASRQH